MISVAMTPRVADAPYDVVELGVQERLAPAERDDAGAKFRQPVHAAKDLIGTNGRRMVVELIAVGASQVTAAYRDEVGGDRPILEPKGFDEHAGLAERPLRFQNATPDRHHCHCFPPSGPERSTVYISAEAEAMRRCRFGQFLVRRS